MSSYVQDQLKATGIAQVIVVLKAPGGAGAGAGAARKGVTASLLQMGAPSWDAVAAGLERYFISPAQSQAQSLARAAAGAAGRKPRRGHAKSALVSLAAGAGGGAPSAVRVYPNLGVALGTVDKTGLKGLRADERVAEVAGALPITLIRPVAVRAVKPTRSVTWGLLRLGVPELWDQGFKGSGVLVGHLDTGIDGKHPALKPAIGHFAEFDLLGNLVPDATPHDTAEHGSHTAGTIAGRPVTATAFGVAPEAMLASAIVIEGGQIIARILAGMDWAVGLGVRVLSMSLGLPGWHDDFLALCRVLRARNVLPVFAAGNEGPGTSRSPGNYDDVLSVGACAQDDHVADFSSSQEFLPKRTVPDLVGPGVGIISSVPGGGFMEMDGTSMATPHIAGLAALLFGALPTATADQVEAALFASCELPATMTADRGNRGVPNGPRALAILKKGALPVAAAALAGTPKAKAKRKPKKNKVVRKRTKV